MGKLFSNAESAEYGIEQIFRGRLADDFAHGIDGVTAQIQRHQFKRCVGLQRLQCQERGRRVRGSAHPDAGN